MPSKPRAKSGTMLAKGKVGTATHYITRNKAIAKLQISLKDFRKLCILKGVFPRNPPKVKNKSQTYYHAKDIAFLHHEPILQKFRDLKIYLRRHTRHMGRYEKHIADRLKAPVFNLNHLVKERYPTFIDALRDMDDPYSTLFLFRSVKLHLARSFDARRINDLERLCGEWLSIVSNAKLLRKTFISIKGFYFQAVVKGQQITWLVPHRVMQNTPVDVDYNIMSTFVQFYETMAKFVNYKVAKDEGLDYPVLFGEEAEKKAVESLFGAAITGTTAVAVKKAANKTEKKAVPVSSAAAAAADAAEAAAEAAASSRASADASEADTSAFHALDPDALPLVDQAAAKQAAVFKGLTFVVSREVPFEPVAFVIRCGGGIAVGETYLTPAQTSSDKFTHHIVDRPGLAAFLPSRSYVQPQWVFDSFNEAHPLPVEPYAVGAKLPPHLSPFVNDEKAGYVPEQRNVLRQWVGLAPLKDGAQRDLKRQPTEEELAAVREAEDEAEYQAGLKAEAKSAKPAAAGKKATAAAPAPKKGTAAAKAAAQKAAEEAEEEEEEEFEFAASDLESDVDDDDDDDDEEGSDVVIDGDADGVDIDEEDSDSEAEATTMADGEEDDDAGSDDEAVNHPKAPRPDSFNARNTERELAKMMVKRRHSYLINEKDRKIKLKAQKAQVLAVKRDAHKAGVENPELPKVHRKRGRH